MRGNCFFIFQVIQQPRPGRRRVGDGLLCGERLGGHTEERRFRIEPLQRFGQVSAVDIGYVVRAEAFFPIRLQRLGHHYRPKIRTTDSNIDDIGEDFSREPFLLTRANCF